MKQLNNVTLVSVAGADSLVPSSIAAMKKSSSQIEFGSKKIFCSNPTLAKGLLKDTEVEHTHMTLEGYSRFCIGELAHHINTEFCLIVQGDGYVISPDLWEDDFLDYDYIGAPWSPLGPNEHCNNTPWVNRIGNGGFSLRSKKFLEVCTPLADKYDPWATHLEPQLPKGNSVPEDWFLCVHNYQYMLSRDIKFPDVHTASRFSVEHPIEEKRYDPEDLATYRSFGFHGSTNTGAMNTILGVVEKINKECGA